MAEETFTSWLADLIKLFADNFETRRPHSSSKYLCPDPEPDFEPKIRDQNPPPWKIERAQDLRQKISVTMNLEKACVVILGGIFFLCLLSGQYFLAIIVIGIGLTIYPAFRMIRREHQQAAAVFSEQVLLDAYNTEFTAPLADRSMVCITVHFHIPREHNIPINSQGTAPHLVEQLNRVTEAKLVVFTQLLTEPPSRLVIQDYLNRELVQFQDDNHVDVLRVQVPLAVHVHPDKPKGVNV
jgi:hypothetical protein